MSYLNNTNIPQTLSTITNTSLVKPTPENLLYDKKNTLSNFKLLSVFLSFFIYLFLAFIFLTPTSATAGVNDCSQTHTDGTVNCSKAQIIWQNVNGQQGDSWDTIVGLMGAGCTYWASIGYSCELKYSTSSWDGFDCPPASCSSVTQWNSTTNTGGIFLRVHPNRAPAPGEDYVVTGGPAYKFFSCPANNTIYYVNGYESALCRNDSYVQSIDLGTKSASLGITTQSSNSCMVDNTTGKTCSGDPVDILSGNKFIIESDYSYDSSWPLQFIRTYNDKLGSWSHNWEYQLSYTDTTAVGKVVTVTLPTGTTWTYKFNSTTNLWDRTNNTDTSILVHDTGTNTFSYKMTNQSVLVFTPLESTGLVTSQAWLASKLIMPGDEFYTIDYSTVGLVNKITSPLGVELVINQATSGTCKNKAFTSITGPGSKTTTYTYDSSCRLTKVTYPDTTYKEYVYSGYDITQVKDELTNIYDKTSYSTTGNRKGRVATSQGLGATGSVNAVNITYNSSTSVVSDALSNSSTITISSVNRQTKPTAYSTLCTWCTGPQGSALSYNANGYLSSITDYNGNITTFTYDTALNLPTQIKESTNNLGLQRQVDITYDSTWGQIATITKPSGAYVSGTYQNNITTNTYDSTTGQITSKTITAPLNDGTTNTATKTWNYTYDSLGQLTSIENPMYSSGVYNDKVTFTYNSTGQVTSITNGLSQATTFSSFNDYGKPQTVTFADSTSLGITYNTRGFITSMLKNNVGSSSSYTTSLTRDARQLVTRITSPSGAYKDLVYDATQRLTEVKEYNESSTYLGKTVFTLDNMSSVTKIQVLDSAGVEIRLMNKQYNNKNLLFKDLTALNYATTYTYDSNGNLTNINDANNKNLIYTYDSLNRISTQTNPDSGVVTYNYNPDDSIASVVDPKSLSTTYKYNGFGEALEVNSPDTGITTMTRNLNGDMTSSTDARSITASYTYDVLHRPTFVDYPGSTEDITITYDSCTNGVGKTCTITDVAGTTTYTYDNFGRVSSSNHTNGGYSKTTSYAYDSSSRLNKITYPSGVEVNYTYSNNKPVTVTYTYMGNTYNVITDGVYDPFDSSIKSYKYGDSANNVNFTKTINKDGLISDITTSVSSNVDKSYSYDTRLNMTAITGAGSSDSASASYDFNSRITNYNYGSGINDSTYNYNTSSDRTSTLINSATTTYTSSSTSHRLDSLSGSVSDTLTYDAAGNQTASTLGSKTFTYNNAGRMSAYSDSSNSFSYLINSLGQRVKKIDNNNSANNVNYVYDVSGKLIAEYDDSNNLLNEYIYLNGIPVALLRSTNLYFIYPDHLGTPRTITDTSNNIKWTWENTEPFGNSTPNETISGSTFKFNLRLPGQYFDNESNLNYNYHRDYNSMLGRYIQSDPIGLNGGLNTYGYVGGNPLGSVDIWGLRDMTPQEGLLIKQRAEFWASQNVPYVFGGKNLKGADCSGSIYRIFQEAGFPYAYTPTSGIPSSTSFRKLGDEENMQIGDLILYKGHVSIYDPTIGGNNNIWTAFNSRSGQPFGAARHDWFKKQGVLGVYRYDVKQ